MEEVIAGFREHLLADAEAKGAQRRAPWRPLDALVGGLWFANDDLVEFELQTYLNLRT